MPREVTSRPIPGAWMRERGVAHQHLDYLDTTSKTELEVAAHWPGLSTPHERERLRFDGFLDGAGQLTALGRRKLAELEAPAKKGGR